MANNGKLSFSQLTGQDTIDDSAIIAITNKNGSSRKITFKTLRDAIQQSVLVGSVDGAGVTAVGTMTANNNEQFDIATLVNGEMAFDFTKIPTEGGFDQLVIVKSKEDLVAPLSSSKLYYIDGAIDMVTQTIEVPIGGINIGGHSGNVSMLFSSEDGYTMFVDPVGGCGPIFQENITISVTGVGSSVYGNVNADGLGLFFCANSIFKDCASLGYLSGFFQGVESITSRNGGSPELEFRGTWGGGYRMDATQSFGLDDASFSIFKAGIGFTMNSRFRTNTNVVLSASSNLCDFSPANFPNPSTLQFDGVLITRNGVADASDANLTPNISAGDLASDWADNVGLPNTFVGGELDITAEITTTIAVANTFVDIEGTAVPAGLQHFDSPANGQLRHLGTSPREYKLSGQYVVDADGNDEVSIKVVVFRSATTSFEDQKTITRTVNTLQGGRNVAYFALSNNIVLNQNDYAKLQVANNNVTDVLAELNSFFTVEAR